MNERCVDYVTYFQNEISKAFYSYALCTHKHILSISNSEMKREKIFNGKNIPLCADVVL